MPVILELKVELNTIYWSKMLSLTFQLKQVNHILEIDAFINTILKTSISFEFNGQLMPDIVSRKKAAR